MKLEARPQVTLFAIALALLGSSSGEAFPSLCGFSYPQDFPCLPDGIPTDGPDMRIPGVKGMSLVTYSGTAEELTARLTEAAKAAGWRVDLHTADEPDGKRYRLKFTRAGRSLGASIYGSPGQVLLQITEFAPDAR
jgi:hypothetical protein